MPYKIIFYFYFSRFVSSQLHFDRPEVPGSTLTNLFTQFGQFIDHDLSLTPELDREDCCEEKDVNDVSECFNIEIPCKEPIFGVVLPTNSTCGDRLEFVRSTAFCDNQVHVR